MILADLLTPAFACATAAAMVGGLLMGFTGFGSTLVMVPLISLVWGPAEAIAIAMGVNMIGTIQLVPEASRDAEWPEVWPAWIGAGVGAPFGTWLLLIGDPEIIRRAMGLIVVSVALIMLRGWQYRGPRTRGVTVGFGVFGGFTTSYFGIGAPAIALYYLSPHTRAAVQRASILLVLGVFSVVTVTTMVIGGGADLGTLVRGTAIYLPYAFSIWIGTLLFRRASDAIYRRVALWLLIGMGVTITFL